MTPGRMATSPAPYQTWEQVVRSFRLRLRLAGKLRVLS